MKIRIMLILLTLCSSACYQLPATLDGLPEVSLQSDIPQTVTIEGKEYELHAIPRAIKKLDGLEPNKPNLCVALVRLNPPCSGLSAEECEELAIEQPATPEHIWVTYRDRVHKISEPFKNQCASLPAPLALVTFDLTVSFKVNDSESILITKKQVKTELLRI